MRKLLTTAFVALALTCLSLFAQEPPLPQPLQWQPVDSPGLGSAVNTLIISPHDSKRILVGGRQFGIYWSVDRGDSWSTAKGLSCYNVNSFLWHPTESGTVWAATMNGVYRSVDAGQTWELRSDGMPVDTFSEFYTYLSPIKTLIMDPVNPQRLLAFCGVSDKGLAPKSRVGGVWETTNNGIRWHKICTITLDGATNDPDAKGINLTAASFAGGIPMLVYATSNEAGFFESTDGGKSWTPQNTGLPHTNIHDMWIEAKSTNTVYVNLASYGDSLGETGALPGGIYKTVSGGLGWFSISGTIPKHTKGPLQELTSFPVFAIASDNPKVMVTCDASSKAAAVYKSSDNGGTWAIIAQQRHSDKQDAEEGVEEQINDGKTAAPPPEDNTPGAGDDITFSAAGFSDVSALKVDPENSDIIFLAGSNFLVRTTDGGVSWRDLVAKPADAAYGGRGLSGLDVRAFVWNPNKTGHLIVASGNSMKFLETHNNGLSWSLRGTEPYYWGGGLSGCIVGDSTYLGTGQFGLYGSIVRGMDGTWQTITGRKHGLPPFKRCGPVTSIASPSPDRLVAVIGGRLYESRDSGSSWTVLLARRDLGHIATIPDKPHFYVSGRENCYLIKGKIVTAIGGPRSSGRIVCDKDGALYLSADRSIRNGLWVYNKKAWIRLLDEDFLSDVAVDPVNPKRLAVCTSSGSGTTANDTATGIWISADGGASWAMANSGLTLKQANAVSFDPNNTERLLVGTEGNGMFAMHWPPDHQVPALRRYASTAEDAKFSSKLAASTGIETRPGTKPSPLKNGNMEQGNTIPTAWTSRWVGKGRILVARDPSTSYDGEASLRIQTVGGPGKGQIAQMVNATGMSEITLTAFVKSEGKVFSQVSVQSFDAKWKTLEYKTVKHFRNQKDWMKASGTIKLPAGTVRFGVGLLIEGNGKAWMDNVTLDVK